MFEILLKKLENASKWVLIHKVTNVLTCFMIISRSPCLCSRYNVPWNSNKWLKMSTTSGLSLLLWYLVLLKTRIYLNPTVGKKHKAILSVIVLVLLLVRRFNQADSGHWLIIDYWSPLILLKSPDGTGSFDPCP